MNSGHFGFILSFMRDRLPKRKKKDVRQRSIYADKNNENDIVSTISRLNKVSSVRDGWCMNVYVHPNSQQR